MADGTATLQRQSQHRVRKSQHDRTMKSRSLLQDPGADELVSRTWEKHAETSPGCEAIVHCQAGEEPFRWLWGELMSAVPGFAAMLGDCGVKPGHVCAIIVRHNKLFYPLYMAIASLGALPAVLAFPNNRLHPQKFRDGLAGMAARSGLDWVLTEESLRTTVEPLLSAAGSAIRGMLFPLDWSRGASSPALGSLQSLGVTPAAPFLLQHSSGTTGLQKAVVLSHRALLEHVRQYGESIRISRDDRIVSWLPLYHDMGLIAAFHLPLAMGIPLVQLDPFEWVSAPVLWLEAVSKEKGTLSWLPNFAYNLMADRIRDEELEDMRLDSLRLLVNCSEPVRAESHDRFYRRFAAIGLRREALGACYAMAETTFAVTQTPLDREARTLLVDRGAIASGTVRTKFGTSSRRCVSSGRPISGCEVRAVDAAGHDLPEATVGELAVQSSSLFDGYRNLPDETSKVLRDGWYYTGDYGFRFEGEWFVVGRKKDIIIVAGRNIYPEDVEDAVGQVPGVLPGRVVAFGLEDEESGTEQVCVIAESNVDTPLGRKRLRAAVIAAGMQIDVTIVRVYLAPPRWLIKSSAGKPARRTNSERAPGELEWS